MYYKIIIIIILLGIIIFLYLYQNHNENFIDIFINPEYVSSYGIMASCEIYSTSPQSSIKDLFGYDFSKVFDGCLIYICNSAIPKFMKKINDINCKFILVSGDADETINDDYIMLLDNPKIIHWYSQNCIIKHPKITQIPIGLDYHTIHFNKNHAWGENSTPSEQEIFLKNIKNTSKPFWKRQIKCYANFHFSIVGALYGYDRSDSLREINKDLVYYEEKKINRNETWKAQVLYAFVISPHGNGLDCHRTWEALCLGCIPIVKTSKLNPLYDNLPVLIVQSWSDITEKLLSDTIDLFKNTQFNYDKLLLKYWINKINDKLNENSVSLYKYSSKNRLKSHIIKMIPEIIDFYKEGSKINNNIIESKQSKQEIPLNIFSTWFTKNLEPGMSEAVESIKLTNPEFNYSLYDDDDCSEFIKNNFDKEIFDAYQMLIPGAYKADLWRYCILYIYGGIYLDIKFIPVNNCKLINLTDKEYFIIDAPPHENDNIGIFNGVMICKKNNPILMNCIMMIVQNVKNRFYGNSCLWPTGPFLLGHAIFDKYSINSKDIEFLFMTDPFTIIYKNTPILKQYNSYRSEQNNTSPIKHYAQLWTDRAIYKDI